MAVQGRWLFALFFAPSAVATLALVVSSYWTERQEREQPSGEHRQLGTSKTLPASESDQAQALSSQVRQLETRPLEDFLPAHQAVEAGGALWQGIVHSWLVAAGSTHPEVSQADSTPYDALMGSTANGVLHIDLPLQGPHALVAGTTGSGKSAFLQDWCLALACQLPPSRLNFVFLDFKGGSAFSQLSRLPHTVGFVSDLNLEAAARAIEGIERELKRREELVASQGLGDTRDLNPEPARLIVVIDEFQALSQQLPDYMDHLVQLASLGRSLGMNLIACTQNPMGQVNAHMRANMNLSICLRVKDSMQSKELLGSSCAALIKPREPGAGFYQDGERLVAFRCAYCKQPEAVVDQVLLASHCYGSASASPLFTPALPTSVSSGQLNTPQAVNTWDDGHPLLCIGLADDGVLWHPCRLPVTGNIAIIGGLGRGKSNLLELIREQLLDLYAHTPGQRSPPGVRMSSYQAGELKEVEVRLPHSGSPRHPTWAYEGKTSKPPAGQLRGSPTLLPPPAPYSVWLIDAADQLMDPLCQDRTAQQVSQALQDPRVCVILALESARLVRKPELFSSQIVFPSGQQSQDLLSGIPTVLLRRLGEQVGSIPGRAVLMSAGQAQQIQCSERRNFAPRP
ncbi:cell division protein FtsK [Bombiscardovia nodaiensis]|uniref:Cell division protein FtsK n=1 Tax=Bombiscardovia nodaiensis TaxID=2932181 RepID=A0ABN6S9L9_9BIFI|nr:cell division protein FtsK [Bombiscardovia nodaiensis]